MEKKEKKNLSCLCILYASGFQLGKGTCRNSGITCFTVCDVLCPK